MPCGCFQGLVRQAFSQKMDHFKGMRGKEREVSGFDLTGENGVLEKNYENFLVLQKNM